MKQHIICEQLNELSDDQKEKLHDWWIQHQDVGSVYKIYHPTDLDNEKPSVSMITLDHENCPTIIFDDRGYPKLDFPQHENWECLPLLSIGQMIEFLSENAKNKDSWLFPLVEEVQIDYPVAIKAEYVCDALWEAVKEELT